MWEAYTHEIPIVPQGITKYTFPGVRKINISFIHRKMKGRDNWLKLDVTSTGAIKAYYPANLILIIFQTTYSIIILSALWHSPTSKSCCSGLQTAQHLCLPLDHFSWPWKEQMSVVMEEDGTSPSLSWTLKQHLFPSLPLELTTQAAVRAKMRFVDPTASPASPSCSTKLHAGRAESCWKDALFHSIWFHGA